MSARDELFNYMDGNLRMSKRHVLLDTFRAEVLREAADKAAPAAPEASFFGDDGPQVAAWLRMLAGEKP